MAWDDKPKDWMPLPEKVEAEVPLCDPVGMSERAHNRARTRADQIAASTPPLKAPGLTPYDITRDWQAEHGGSWSDVSRHLWGD
jgi:hypothetical protein